MQRCLGTESKQMRGLREERLLPALRCQVYSVNIRTPKPVENFYKNLSQSDSMLENKISDALVNDSFAVSFIHVELRKITCKWKKATPGNL